MLRSRWWWRWWWCCSMTSRVRTRTLSILLQSQPPPLLSPPLLYFKTLTLITATTHHSQFPGFNKFENFFYWQNTDRCCHSTHSVERGSQIQTERNNHNCLVLIQVNTGLIIVHKLEIYCIKAFIQTLKIHISKKHFSLFDVFDRRFSKDSRNMKYYKAKWRL